jgi:hypothetical protein
VNGQNEGLSITFNLLHAVFRKFEDGCGRGTRAN